jgi:two-component system chemotaxis response regulator CheY
MGATAIVVDDSTFMRGLITSMLRNLGVFVVAQGGNGDDAAELYKLHKPTFVTMDITMPEVDGLEGLRRIMEFDPLANVIMVSSMGQSFHTIEAVRLGAKDFIVKPFNTDRVAESIRKIIK